MCFYLHSYFSTNVFSGVYACKTAMCLVIFIIMVLFFWVFFCHQIFLLLFSLKLTSLVLFMLSFWRENSFLCFSPCSQMSHSTEPVTTFNLTFLGVGRHGNVTASHTYTSKPSSFRMWAALIRSSLLLLFPFLSFTAGKDKGDIFSVKRSVKFPV